MPVKEDLVASGRTNDEICKEISCDKLIYQDLDDLKKCISDINANITSFEDSVFSGNYVVGDINEDYLTSLEGRGGDNTPHNEKTNTSLLHNITIDMGK